MTYLEMQDAVLEELEETGDGTFHTRDEVKDRLNDALRDFAEHTEFYTKSVSISLVGNQIHYYLPDTDATVIAIRRLYNDQTSRWLRGKSVTEMDSAYMFWSSVTGSPEVAFPRGPLTFGIWPAKATSTGTLTAKCAAVPAALSADGDTINLPDEYHRALVEYAKYELLLEGREFKKAMRAYKAYRGLADRAAEYVQRRGNVSGVIGG